VHKKTKFLHHLFQFLPGVNEIMKETADVADTIDMETEDFYAIDFVETEIEVGHYEDVNDTGEPFHENFLNLASGSNSLPQVHMTSWPEGKFL